MIKLPAGTLLRASAGGVRYLLRTVDAIDRRLIERCRDHVLGGARAAPLRPCSSVGFLLDLAARPRQIGRVNHYHARRAAGSMNKLLERLKQGLRSIGRGHSDGHDVSRGNHAVNDRERDTRLRTELDDAPSSLDKRSAPSAPSTGCTRKAVLSNARRTSGPQNAMTLWGPAPTSRTSLFDDSGASAPATVLSGSTLVPRPPPADAGPRRSPLGLLEGAFPFSTSAEAAKAPSPTEMANPFTSDDDRIDRLF